MLGTRSRSIVVARVGQWGWEGPCGRHAWRTVWPCPVAEWTCLVACGRSLGDCVAMWVWFLSLCGTLCVGSPCAWHPQGPLIHPTAPCHYISDNHPAPDDGPVDTRVGWWDRRNVVARGWVGGGWALVGARSLATTLGWEFHWGHLKTVRERVSGGQVSPASQPSDFGWSR